VCGDGATGLWLEEACDKLHFTRTGIRRSDGGRRRRPQHEGDRRLPTVAGCERRNGQVERQRGVGQRRGDSHSRIRDGGRRDRGLWLLAGGVVVARAGLHSDIAPIRSYLEAVYATVLSFRTSLDSKKVVGAALGQHGRHQPVGIVVVDDGPAPGGLGHRPQELDAPQVGIVERP
jgi:hypothetical protein